MKFIAEIEMQEHNCMYCPLYNGADECVLQTEDENFEADSLEVLLNGCPLIEREVGR